MTNSKLSDLQKKADQLLENGSTLEALQEYDKAVISSQQENNYDALVMTLLARSNAWGHFFMFSKDKIFNFLALKDAETALEVIKDKKLDDKRSTCYVWLADALVRLNKYKKAIFFYKKALTKFKGKLAEKCRIRNRLGETYYLKGEKELGKKEMLRGLAIIEKNKTDFDQFIIDVWISGCYIALYRTMIDDEPKLAKEYLDKAKKIVDNNPKLVVRKKQLEELLKV